jgi:methionyl-tRNA synthetase
MPRYLVTSALPYANGPIHFGHIVGAYLPADVYARYRRMRGDEVKFVCGADEHGVAITINAEAQNRDYREFVKFWREEIHSTFTAFGIEFDIFSGTSACKPHARIAQEFFSHLDANGYLQQKTEKQWFCETHQMFLADRYLEGTCPFCGAANARGDECKKCGQWIDALALKDPKCKLCGHPPRVRDTLHWYLDLPKIHADGFGDWFEGRDPSRPHVDWKPNVRAFVANMLRELNVRPITRDLRWGVKLPAKFNAPDDKVLYVWFDAPIGYCSMTQELLEREGKTGDRAWLDWWSDDNTRIVHFIGKDNIGFHTIVFPSMLFGQSTSYGRKLNLPYAVPAMEFYNLQGRKFSTSDGWTIDPKEFLRKFPNVDTLRFMLMATAPETADSEFTFEEYQRINNELANNIGNLLSRALKFATEKLGGKVARFDIEGPAGTALSQVERESAALLENLEKFGFRAACENLLEMGRIANRYFDQMAPWKAIKSDHPSERQQAAVCIDMTTRMLAGIGLCAEPFMPGISKEIRTAVGINDIPSKSFRPGSLATHAWRELAVTHVPILFQKLDDKVIAAEIESLKSKTTKMETPKPAQPAVSYNPPAGPAPAAAPAPDPNAPKPTIQYEDFAKIEFRTGTVIAAERVANADKLLRLQVELGGGQTRQIVAGIAAKYAPEQLLQKRVVVVCNLAPRKMRGVESQGMILAADDGHGPVVISPSADVANGATVK